MYHKKHSGRERPSGAIGVALAFLLALCCKSSGTYVQVEVSPLAAHDLGCQEPIQTRCLDKDCLSAEAAGCGRTATYSYDGNWRLTPLDAHENNLPPAHTVGYGGGCRHLLPGWSMCPDPGSEGHGVIVMEAGEWKGYPVDTTKVQFALDTAGRILSVRVNTSGGGASQSDSWGDARLVAFKSYGKEMSLVFMVRPRGAGGTSSFLKVAYGLESKRLTMRPSSEVTSADRDEVASLEEVRLDENGHGVLAVDTEIQKHKFKAGTEVWFDGNKKLLSATLGADTRIQGVDFAARTSIEIADDGRLRKAELVADTTYEGITYRSGTSLDFFSSGRVSHGSLATDTTIQGVTLRGGTAVVFHDDGSLHLGLPVKDVTIAGVQYKAGVVAVFPEGATAASSETQKAK